MFLKAQTWLSLVTESTRGWDSSVVTPGNTTYTSSVVAERILNNAVTALHSHGVPDQIYMGMEDGCVRKATGDTVYTLWCNSSSEDGTFEPIIKKVDFGPSWDDTERCEARLDGIYCGGEVTNANTDEPANPPYETAPMIKVSSVTDVTRVESVLPKGDSYERNVCFTRSSAPRVVSCVDMAGSSTGNYTLPGSITTFAFAKEWGHVKIIARMSDGTAVYQDGQNNEVHKFNAQVEDVAFASYQGSAVPAILANGSLKFGINVGAEGWTDATGSAQGSITQVDMTPPGLNVVAGGALYSSSYFSGEGLIKVTDSGYSVTGALRNVGGGCAITASGLVCEENGTPRLVSSVSWDEFSPRSDTAGISALWNSAEGVKYLVKSPEGTFSVVDSVS